MYLAYRFFLAIYAVLLNNDNGLTKYVDLHNYQPAVINRKCYFSVGSNKTILCLHILKGTWHINLRH